MSNSASAATRRSEPPLGYTLFELARALALDPKDILKFEADGKIRSSKLPDGRRFYAHTEVARLLGEESL